MVALTRRHREAYALALALGASPLEAAEKAGYSFPRNRIGLAKARDIVIREAEIRQLRAGGGSRDLGGIIDELVATAGEGRKLNTAQGIAAAKGVYELIGKFKDKLPDPAKAPPPPQPAVLHPHDADISEEEWTRLYGPNAPGKGCNLP